MFSPSQPMRPLAQSQRRRSRSLSQLSSHQSRRWSREPVKFICWNAAGLARQARQGHSSSMRGMPPPSQRRFWLLRLRKTTCRASPMRLSTFAPCSCFVRWVWAARTRWRFAQAGGNLAALSPLQQAQPRLDLRVPRLYPLTLLWQAHFASRSHSASRQV